MPAGTGRGAVTRIVERSGLLLEDVVQQAGDGAEEPQEGAQGAGEGEDTPEDGESAEGAEEPAE